MISEISLMPVAKKKTLQQTRVSGDLTSIEVLHSMGFAPRPIHSTGGRGEVRKMGQG